MAALLLGIGGVTHQSAVYRGRADGANATLKIEWSVNSDLSESTISTGVSVTSDTDYTGGETFTGLPAATRIYYTLLVDDVRLDSSGFAFFDTFPAPTVSDTTLRLVFGSCIDNTTHAIFSAIDSVDPHIVAILGDFQYIDSTVLATQRSGYRGAYSGQLQSLIVRKRARVHMYDDHDGGTNDWNGDLSGKENGLQALKEYCPLYTLPNGSNGAWHSFTYGKLAEVFVIDPRYQREGVKERFPASSTRTADTGSSGTSLVLRSADSPSGSDDAYNTWFAVVTTASGTHRRRVSDYDATTRTCTLSASIADLTSSSTYYLRRASMLDMDGIADGQLDWLINGIRNSTRVWKVILSPVQMNLSANHADTWGSWDTEEVEARYLMQELADVPNIICCTADLHAVGCDDGTNSMWPELTASPMVKGVETINGNWTNGTSSADQAFGLLTLTRYAAELEAKDESGNTVSGVTPLTVAWEPDGVNDQRILWLRGA